VARFIADKVVPAIQALVEWIGKNKEVIPAVGIAIAVLLVPAFIAWAISAGAAAVATIAAAAPVILIGLLIAALAFLIIKNWDTIKDVTLKVFGAVWSFLKGLWEKVTGFIGRAIETVKTIFFRFNPLGIIIKNWGKITGWITDQWSKIKERISNAVGKIKGFFSGMWDGIKNGLKSALNGAISLINSAIGGINTLIAGVNKVPGVSIPSIPTIPRLHSGGVVPGPLGKEVPILARAGERVLTREQDLAGGGGDTNVTVIIDGRAIDESLVRVVRSRDRGLKRRVRAGSGAFA
jgi:phage-related protein